MIWGWGKVGSINVIKVQVILKKLELIHVSTIVKAGVEIKQTTYCCLVDTFPISIHFPILKEQSVGLYMYYYTLNQIGISKTSN